MRPEVAYAQSLKQLEFPQDPGAASMDGKSVHGVIVDELHAHRVRVSLVPPKEDEDEMEEFFP